MHIRFSTFLELYVTTLACKLTPVAHVVLSLNLEFLFTVCVCVCVCVCVWEYRWILLLNVLFVASFLASVTLYMI